LVSEDLIRVALGDNWLPASYPLVLLSFYAAHSSITSLLPQVLNATGRPAMSMWNSLLKLAILPVAFWFASRWEAVGIAATWLLLFPFLSIPLYWAVFRAIDLSASQYATALVPALECSAAILAAVASTSTLLPVGVAAWLSLAIKVSAGLIAVAIVLVSVQRDTVLAYLRVLRTWRACKQGHGAEKGTQNDSLSADDHNAATYVRQCSVRE
jgi:O-antigen/teichoic acid export membrane protein